MAESALGNNVANDGGSVRFPCPKCGTDIVRTQNEREIVAKYTCKCGLVGPN